MGIWGTDTWRLEDSANKDNIGIVLGAYRSTLHPAAYVTMPITTGKLCYDVLERNGAKTIDELARTDKDSLWNDIIKPNIEQGVESARTLAELSPLPVIAPSVFEAKKQRWSQHDYMFLWFRVLEERAGHHYLLDGWQYSNGGAEEFVRSMEMQFGFINPENGMEHFPKETDLEAEFKRIQKIRVFAQDGREIRLEEGAHLLKEAIKDLHRRGFKSPVLAESYWKLASIVGYFYDHFTPSREMPPYHVSYSVCKDLEELRPIIGSSEELPTHKAFAASVIGKAFGRAL